MKKKAASLISAGLLAVSGKIAAPADAQEQAIYGNESSATTNNAGMDINFYGQNEKLKILNESLPEAILTRVKRLIKNKFYEEAMSFLNERNVKKNEFYIADTSF